MARVLVTGANGFIGSHLCEYLVHQGYQVRALVRKTSNREWLEGLPVELFFGDLTSPDTLKDAVAGVQAVLHTAAVVRARRQEDFVRVNYEGTKALAWLAVEAGVEHFVLFSSVAAAGPGSPDRPLDETRTPMPVSNYGRAKLAAENAVLELKERMQVVLLRFPAVYGPRDRDGLMLWRTFARGWAPVLGGTFSLIYVADAVRAAVLAMERDVPSGAIYFVSDGNCYNYDMIAREWERITGKRLRRLRVPLVLGMLAARIYSWLKREGTIFNPDKVRELSQECWVCENRRAETELGFKPEYDLCRGGEITLRWYKERGWI